MASVTIGDFRFDVISHERVIIGASVEERFVIAHFFQGQPQQISNPPDFPDHPNWEKWKFVGKVSQDVYAPFNAASAEGGVQLTEVEAKRREDRGQLVVYEKVGTKRGADIRSTFHWKIYQRALAAQRGVRMGTLDDAEIELATRDAKADLKTRSLDEAVVALTGKPLVTREAQR